METPGKRHLLDDVALGALEAFEAGDLSGVAMGMTYERAVGQEQDRRTAKGRFDSATQLRVSQGY